MSAGSGEQSRGITGFHAHVYYDANTKGIAEQVREGVAASFPDAALGRWHDKPIGPHPMGSYQIAFTPDLFGSLIPWLATHRRGLTVFIHTETGDDLTDHTDNAMWMGSIEELDISLFVKKEG